MLGCSFSMLVKKQLTAWPDPSQDVTSTEVDEPWWKYLSDQSVKALAELLGSSFLAVRWQNTTSCRFQPHQACSSAISAMESLSSYETLVVLPKGSEVDDELLDTSYLEGLFECMQVFGSRWDSRIAHLSAESLSDHGRWFDMCL